jgi:hypothetical protein
VWCSGVVFRPRWVWGVDGLRDGDKRVSVWQLDHGAFGCGRGYWAWAILTQTKEKRGRKRLKSKSSLSSSLLSCLFGFCSVVCAVPFCLCFVVLTFVAQRDSDSLSLSGQL